jgi:hypothetical protein
MALTNQQIERYSRQIIVSGVGGLGQERLLACRLMLAGSLANVEPVLAYMVGAGVGAISLQTAERDPAALAGMLDRMRRLNSDVVIDCSAEAPDGITLALVLIGDNEQLELARAACKHNARILFVRLDTPARIAVFPSSSPCPVCVPSGFMAPLTPRGENAGFVAMAAAALAIKAIASAEAIAPAPTLIEFDGYRTVTSLIDQGSIPAGCSCGVRSAS